MRSSTLGTDLPPSRVLLTPWGHVESANGSFIVDEESARLSVAAFEAHGTDLPLDYEHQTLSGTFASPSGQAPAAGWIKKIIAEPGVGLLAEIEWTEPAKELLSTRQYRYISPVAIIRKSDRKLVAIHSAALTNKPAIVGMEPVVHRAGDDAIDPSQTLVALCEDLDLPAATDTHEVLEAAWRQISELRCVARRNHIDSRLSDAMRSGHLAESQRAWAQALLETDEELFEQWLQTAKVVVPLGATRPPAQSNPESRHRAVAARARAEYRSNRLLAALTTEEAYVADAMHNPDR